MNTTPQDTTGNGELDKQIDSILLWWQGKTTPAEHHRRYDEAREQLLSLLLEARIDEYLNAEEAWFNGTEGQPNEYFDTRQGKLEAARQTKGDTR